MIELTNHPTAGEAGKILMSFETYSHVKDLVEVSELNSIKMKGVSRKVKVFEVIGRKKSEIKCVEILKQDNVNDNKKINNLNKKIKEIDRQFKYLKNLIDDLNDEKQN